MPGVRPADHLIRDDEVHFRHLWQVTRAGENAEAYWSSDGKRLVLQRRNADEGIECDRIFVTDRETGALTQVSDGRGACTCSYFLPGDREVVFASTRGSVPGCPPEVDRSQGYVWPVWPEHDLWVGDLESGALRRLTDQAGYDAEATVSPKGDRMVFTSTRSGDLELWTMDLDGGNPKQVTDSLGYDGGAFFSHDGKRLVFRATVFAEGEKGEAERAQYKELLARWVIRPQALEVFVVDADGSNRRQVTHLGGANWAPFFFPDDKRLIFSTNHHDPDYSDGINFDLYAVDLDGTDLERLTTYEGFDAFPMFSPDGRFLAFSSNRGGTKPGETNVFIAEWR
jgi:Tol biopolymer transport system component